MRRNKKYYLKMMSRGQITDEQVAEKFNTSVQKVRKAFVGYSKNKNPFRPLNFKFYFEVISILLVLLTLLEMQVSRNNAYLPDIYFNNTTFTITWDEYGLTGSDHLEDVLFQNLTSSTDYINEIPKIKLTNIGVGTAKYIYIEWIHDDNLQKLVDYLYKVNNQATFRYKINNGTNTLIVNENMYTTSKPYREIAYMKNESEDKIIVFPYEYWECIRESCINFSDPNVRPPFLDLLLRYSDVQGKVYTVKKTLTIEPTMIVIQADNSGYAQFEIKETNTEKKSSLRWFLS